jgi:hypothetical protein
MRNFSRVILHSIMAQKISKASTSIPPTTELCQARLQAKKFEQPASHVFERGRIDVFKQVKHLVITQIK